MNTLILEKLSVGGQIILSSIIENYPGFPEGVSTYELIDKFKRQVDALGIKIENKEVIGIESENKSGTNIYNIRTQDVNFLAKSIIIATGAQPKKLGVDGEDKFIGRGVSYCGTCDGPLFKDKDIIVVGGGDRAIEEAIFLSAYANKIYLVHRRLNLRASGILEEKARRNSKINFVLESIIEKIQGGDKVEELLIRNVRTNTQSKISCQGVFIFVGIKPNTAFLKNLIEMDEKGFIITDQKMQTSQGAIFACGDCRSRSLYQVISACGDGATAADAAHKYLLNQ